ncbi:MAG: methyltransferase domain-containing protein [Nanoarchaeota archaeon]|nr:methyltransferase domain-containing protein [Nanoarchaeota archaeon]
MVKNSNNNDDDGEVPPQKNNNSKSHKKNGNGKIKTLGPIEDLEPHVSPDWWGRIFNSLYLKTDGDVVNDESITKQEINHFLSILKPSSEDIILDLCCGQGRHLFELARRDFKNLQGLDRSHYLIQKAKDKLKKEIFNINLKEGDARKLPYQQDTFDVVLILGNSFGYFSTKEEDFTIIKECSKVLKPYGKILIDVADGDYLKENFQKRSWEWIDKNNFVCRERQLSKDGRLISREVITNICKGIIADQFYSERLYNKEELLKLFEKASFININFHGALSPVSKRNQDLGMMGNRLIVTAEIKKTWNPKKVKQKENIKNVVVIMGDPTKSDPLKPHNKFDEDDFYTINQLKNALSKIEGYKFIYLTNHSTLIEDLKKLKGKFDFVFNLCDEGFNNNPRNELHIPSILDLLNINYTGAGPQCLAFCYDKSLVRGIAKEMGIPVPKAYLIKPDDTIITIPESTFPVIVKPNFGDSSFGITQHCVVKNSEELLNAITEIRQKFGYDKTMIVEEFLTGKDLTLGVIGNQKNNYFLLDITEDDYSKLPEDLPKICGYEAKWEPNSPYSLIETIPADLSEKLKDMIVENSIKLFERLECKDYARFDWRLDAKGNPKLLEINPNPGWCWDGHLSKIAKYNGISYPKMLLFILQATEQRLNLHVTNKENS